MAGDELLFSMIAFGFWDQMDFHYAPKSGHVDIHKMSDISQWSAKKQSLLSNRTNLQNRTQLKKNLITYDPPTLGPIWIKNNIK